MQSFFCPTQQPQDSLKNLYNEYFRVSKKLFRPSTSTTDPLKVPDFDQREVEEQLISNPEAKVPKATTLPLKPIKILGNTQKDKDQQQVYQILKDWLLENIDNPYPSTTTRLELAKQTGLTPSQVQVWFNNTRQRYLDPLKKKNKQREKNQKKLKLIGDRAKQCDASLEKINFKNERSIQDSFHQINDPAKSMSDSLPPSEEGKPQIIPKIKGDSPTLQQQQQVFVSSVPQVLTMPVTVPTIYFMTPLVVQPWLNQMQFHQLQWQQWQSYAKYMDQQRLEGLVMQELGK